MARNDWSLEEIGLLIDNFTKQKDEIGKILLENGFDRTMEAIKTKKRDLKRRGEVAGSRDEREPDGMEPIGSLGVEAVEYVGGKEENEGASGRVAPGSGGAGFFPSATKRDIYGNYKSMMEELIAETRASSVVVADGSPVESENESLVIMLSDLHIGKNIKDECGVERYNVEIALERIEQIGTGIKRVIGHVKKGARVDEVVVCMIGDMLEGGGDIYKTQAHHLDDHVAGQLKAATRSLWKLITDLADIEGIEKVRVATVRGNHGRLSDFTHEDSNIDNLLYDNLEFAATLHGDEKISVTTKYAPYHIVTVKGHRLLLRHEAPLTCDTSAARAKLGGWCEIHGPISAILSGHYHHTQISTYGDKYILRNSSLCGPDDLSEKMGVHAKPEQIVFGISQKRMPTYIYPVTLA